jgi:hypothetical protein
VQRTQFQMVAILPAMANPLRLPLEGSPAMRNPVILGVGLLLLASRPFQVWADELTCVVPLGRERPD